MQPPEHSSPIRGVVTDAAVAFILPLFISLVVGSLQFAGVLLMPAALISLAIAWFVAVLGVYCFPFVRRRRILVMVVTAIFLAIVALVEVLYHSPPAAPPSAHDIALEMERRFANNPPVPVDFSCEIQIERSSRIVMRLIASHPMIEVLSHGNTISFNGKQFFYESNIRILPRSPMRDMRIFITGISDNDSIILMPTDGLLSKKSEPRWISGFPEKREPDFYATTVRIPLASQMKPIEISIRRLLDNANTTGVEIPLLEKIESSACLIRPDVVDLKEERNDLAHKAISLNQQRSAEGLPFIKDLHEVSRPEVRATIEMVCIDNECQEMNASRLAVHLGVTPHEFSLIKELDQLIWMTKAFGLGLH
jgi:hypothetical protein